MDNSIRRRIFLKGALSVVALFSINKLIAINRFLQDEGIKKQYFINPAYSIESTSDGTLFFKTTMPNGNYNKIGLKGIYSDIIQLIIEKKQPLDWIPQLAFKNNMTIQNCQHKCDSILAEMEQKCFIITEQSKISITQKEVNEEKQ
jgi:hypothetical protein